MKKLLINIGDIFEIPLPDGRNAYGQYVYADEKRGPIIQIYNYFTKKDEPFEINTLLQSKLLFRPVFVGINPPIRTKRWKIVGNIPVTNFKYPGFISTLTNFKTGEASSWFLWDGKQSVHLGRHLDDKYKELEYSAIYPAEFIEERIMDGKKPNEELIMTNKEPLAPPMTKEEKDRLNKIITGKN